MRTDGSQAAGAAPQRDVMLEQFLLQRQRISLGNLEGHDAASMPGVAMAKPFAPKQREPLTRVIGHGENSRRHLFGRMPPEQFQARPQSQEAGDVITSSFVSSAAESLTFNSMRL